MVNCLSVFPNPCGGQGIGRQVIVKCKRGDYPIGIGTDIRSIFIPIGKKREVIPAVVAEEGWYAYTVAGMSRDWPQAMVDAEPDGGIIRLVFECSSIGCVIFRFHERIDAILFTEHGSYSGDCSGIPDAVISPVREIRVSMCQGLALAIEGDPAKEMRQFHGSTAELCCVREQFIADDLPEQMTG